MITIAIPVEKESIQLDRTVDLVNQYTKGFKLLIDIDPSINVAEAREKILSKIDTRYVCFLDYDSEMIDPEWLPKMLATMQNNNAALVFGQELWGTEEEVIHSMQELELNPNQDNEIPYGPAACMLIDTHHSATKSKWDYNIGLRNGWLGGDFEEVDWAYKVKAKGGKILRCASSYFRHTGGKTTFKRFRSKDRKTTSLIMEILLAYKHRYEREDFFRNLQYVRASSNDDNELAPGQSLRTCYHQVIKDNNLEHVVKFQQLGLV